MIRPLRSLAAARIAFERWWAATRSKRSSQPRACQRNPADDRRRQALAARRAFLGDLSPNQRALAQRPYGDQI